MPLLENCLHWASCATQLPRSCNPRWARLSLCCLEAVVIQSPLSAALPRYQNKHCRDQTGRDGRTGVEGYDPHTPKLHLAVVQLSRTAALGHVIRSVPRSVCQIRRKSTPKVTVGPGSCPASGTSIKTRASAKLNAFPRFTGSTKATMPRFHAPKYPDGGV